MKTNWVRERLQAGQATIGCFLGLESPNIAEMMSHVGYDWLVVETEHNGLDSAEIEHMLMAMNGTDTVPIVRIPSSNPVFIQRSLDLGAMGIVVPMVKTAAEAKAIVSATRFPPHGKRSWGPLRASHYTLDSEDYYDRANDNILVVLIVEQKEAVENLEEIASVSGIDALFVGPADLSLSMGLNPMRLPHPEIEQVLDRMLAVGRRTQVAVGEGCHTPERLSELQGKGATFIAYGPDYWLLANAARTGLEAFDRKPR